MTRPLFHLAFPVSDLQAAKEFYKDVLNARTGRERDGWMDIILFGAQITLHHRPWEVLAPDQHGVRHFGATLPWGEWEALVSELASRGIEFKHAPTVFHAGTPDEQARLYLVDPSGNVIELKTYRYPAAVLKLEPDTMEV